jgi:O-antigen ligase
MDFSRSIISKFRLPYHDDPIFGLVFFSVLAVPLVFSFWTFENYDVIKWPLWLLATAVVLILVCRGSLTRFRHEPRLLIIFIGFIVWAVVATVFSVDRVNSIFGYYPRFTSSLPFWLVFSAYTLVIVHMLTRDKLMVLLKLLALISFLFSIVAVLQAMGIGFYGGADATLFPRVPSFLGNPDFSSLFVAATVPIILFLAMNASGWKWKFYYGVNSFVVIWAVAAMSSRGAIVGVVAGLAAVGTLILLFRLSRRALWFLAAAAMTLAVLFGLFYVSSRPAGLASTVQLSDSNITSRVVVWDQSLWIMRQHPLVAGGLGNFQLMFQEFRPRLQFGYDILFDDAHNIFLQIGATGGFPLLLIFLLLLAWPVTLGLRQARRDRDWMPVALLGGIVTFVVAASFTPVTVPSYLLLAVFIAGLAYPQARTGRLPDVADNILRPTGVVLGIAGIILSLCFFSSEVLAFQGYRQYLNHSFYASYGYDQWAMRLNPFQSLHYVELASTEVQLRFPPDRITPAIEKISQLHPRDGHGYEQKASLYYLLYTKYREPRFLELAFVNGRQAIAYNPYATGQYQLMSYIAYQSGRYDVAEQYLLPALSLNQSDFQSWVLLAKVYQLQGKRDQAIFALQKAFKLQPDLPQWHAIMQAIKQDPDIKTVNIPVILRDISDPFASAPQ